MNTFGNRQDKENKLNKKITLSKLQWVTLIVATIFIITAFLISLVNFIGKNNKQLEKDDNLLLSPELARAMTYNLFDNYDVYEVDGNGQVTENVVDSVKFGAFFLRRNAQGIAEPVVGTCKEVGKQDTLYMELNVLSDGILKNAKVTIDGKNFYLKTILPKDSEIKENTVSENTREIKFNTIVNGTQKMFYTTVRSGDYTYEYSKYYAIGSTNTNNYSRKDNKIIFTGTYEVATEDGTIEIPIKKEIPITVDWYGKASTYIPNTNLNYNTLDNAIDRENGRLNLSLTISTEEKDKELMLSKNHVEGTIPELNGYAPISVTSSQSGFSYNAETKTFSLDKSSVKNAEGIIISSLSRRNDYTINITYPIEAYDNQELDYVKIQIPVQEYYECFNNPNSEFQNPYKTNTASAVVTATFKKYVPQVIYRDPTIDIIVGRYVYDPYRDYIVSKEKPLRIYNELSSEEIDDTYQVYWYVSTGTNPTGEKIVLRESNVAPSVTMVENENQQVDKFVKADSSLDSMENITINKSISFGNLSSILTREGSVKVYDDSTGMLLLEIDKNNIESYKNGQKFTFSTPVKHIRVEIEGYRASDSLDIYTTKELDDNEITDEERGYSREAFDDLQFIRSYLVGYMGERMIGNINDRAIYAAPFSLATIELSQPVISTQSTEKNEIITIKAEYNPSNNEVGWTNGDFLIKLPAEIIAVEINEVTVDNNSITITNKEVIENEEGRFIKINTENNTPTGFNISIDTDITPDPRADTATKPIILYASNSEGTYYYYQGTDIYDVNNNLSITDPINETSTEIELVSPNSLLTNSTVSEFDDEGTIIVSPQVADIKPAYVNVDNEELTAKIGVQIKNNYSNVISDLLLIGKIPFEGNTYAVTGGDLGSTFDTQMTDMGVAIPPELIGLVDIYYSTNENPSKDLINNAGEFNTDWVKAEAVENWSEIKTYLIDFKSVEMAPGVEYVFYYEVEIPDNLDFNEISYSHHGVYFALNTEEGKYKTRTEPNKIGIRIADKYNLSLNKYQTGHENKITGATYVLTEIFNIDGDEKEGKSKSAITNLDGTITIDNLYAEIMYELKEIKTPEDYELNTDKIRFIGHANKQTGELTIEVVSGETRDEIEIEKNENNRFVTTVNVEDEAKARLKIVKINDETDQPLKGVKFKLTGYGLPERGKNVKTNANGEIVLKGLKVGEEYSLEETKVVDYYLLAGKIKFKITNENGEYNVEIIEDGTQKEVNETENGGTTTTISNIKNYSVELENFIPRANITLSNEKIPTYNLVLTKIKHTTKTTNNNIEQDNEEIVYLAGSKFKLFKDNKELGTYITDETGRLYINDLYQYVDGKDFNATYILKETLIPEGYSKVKDIKFRVQEVDGELRFVEELQEGQTAKEFTVEDNTVNIVVEDNPSFKLIKKDGETDELLPNTKFAIYNIDEGMEPARNSKGELLGNKEIIDGKEYNILTTDSNGEITADLPEGLYKAVEIEASDIKYDLTDMEWYFGIGASREGEEGRTTNVLYYTNAPGWDSFNQIEKTSDGGYIIGGYYADDFQIEDFEFNNTGNKDSCLIKYDNENRIEWNFIFGGEENEEILDLSKCEDDGFLVLIKTGSDSYLLQDEYYEKMYRNGYVVIKINSFGDLEWKKEFEIEINCAIPKNDGNYLIGGHCTGVHYIDGFMVEGVNDGTGVFITLDSEGTVINAKDTDRWSYGNIKKMIPTEDGGYIVFATAGRTMYIGNNHVSASGTLLFKLDENDNVEWYKKFGSSYGYILQDMIETSNNDIIVSMNFSQNTITIGNKTYTNAHSGYYDAIIASFSIDGDVNWSYAISTGNYDYAYYLSESLNGNILFCAENGSATTFANVSVIGKENSILTELTPDGHVENLQYIGEYGDYFCKTIELEPGQYISIGSFQNTIAIGGKTYHVGGGSDGIIIESKENEISYSGVKHKLFTHGIGGNSLNHVCKTFDGGNIVSGQMSNSNLYVNNDLVYDSQIYGGFLAKVGNTGNTEWEKVLPQININTIVEDKEKNIIVGANSYYAGTYEGFTYPASSNLLLIISSTGELRNGFIFKNGSITKILVNDDNEIIIVGTFTGTLSCNNETILTTNDTAGYILKMNNQGTIIGRKVFGEKGGIRITDFDITTDDGIVIGGSFSKEKLQLENFEIVNTLYKANSTYYTDGIVIKFNKDMNLDWYKDFPGFESSVTAVAKGKNGAVRVAGRTHNGIDFGNNIRFINKWNTDSYIVEFNSEGEAVWLNGIQGEGTEVVNKLISTKDGGLVAVGLFDEFLYLNRYTLKSKTVYDDSFIIKYNSEGKEEWTSQVGGTSDDTVLEVSEMVDGKIAIVGTTKSPELIVNGNTCYSRDSSNSNVDGFYLTLIPLDCAEEQNELIVTNKRKEYKITTDIQEIDNIKGGTISGEDKLPYEVIKYGDSSTKEIRMIPDENYEIISITVNGEEWEYEVEPDGSYTMPQFTNMTEDKHIIVTYSLKDNKITINKKDNYNNNIGISGVEFKLDQIEERTEPIISELTEELIDNSKEYTIIEPIEEITDRIGEMTNNNNYYFIEQNGYYVPTNSKTYQVSIGGNSGIQSSEAWSYMPIDLTNLEGTFSIFINASVESESPDYGVAFVTENTTKPNYNSGDNRFISISGTKPQKTYKSFLLEGGKTYYLHLGYRKDVSADTGSDQVKFSNIKLYKAHEVIHNYKFEYEDGKYVSNNSNVDATCAYSIIPIDLSELTGKYDFTINVSISSETDTDYGYVSITNTTERKEYNDATDRLVYISGVQTNKEYTKVLTGGKVYYLHLGYYKNDYTSSNEDKFTINGFDIKLNDSELYHTTVKTNSEGQAITQIPFGKYTVTEINTPDGYWPLQEPIEIEFRSFEGATHEFNIENERKGKIIVHHYLKDNDGNYTTTKLAEDEISYGHIGDNYSTLPRFDIAEYELETDENEKQVLPENANGSYETDEIEINYYYEEKKIPLVVHHYIRGTTNSVPLATGNTAEDIIDKGKKGESYTTEAIPQEELDPNYEIVTEELPINATGIYEDTEIEVTYYYDPVIRNVEIIKKDESKDIYLQGAKFSITENGEPSNIVTIGDLVNNSNYGFTKEGDSYISGGKGINNAVSTSYIKIDMSQATNKIIVKINAEISSESNCDFGYVFINESTTTPSYSTTTDRLFRISGTGQPAQNYEKILNPGKVYYLHMGYRKDGSVNRELDRFKINKIEYEGIENKLELTTNEKGKIITQLNSGEYILTEVEAPEGYKLNNLTETFTIDRDTDTVELTIDNEKKKGTVTVNHFVEGTTTPIELSDGSLAPTENKTGEIGTIYATQPHTDITKYELVSGDVQNGSGEYIDGNITVVYEYRAIPTSVLVHHYLEGTTTSLADDILIEGYVSDNYTTGVANVDNKYELVAIPENANGVMTRDQTVVTYYYRLKDAQVRVHYYAEGTTNKLSEDVTIDGKVDDSYSTSEATDIPSKYELVAEPDNKTGIMTVEPIDVIYYYRLKETGVDVHYYLIDNEGNETTNKVLHTNGTEVADVTIEGRVDDSYSTSEATDIMSKYRLVRTTNNTSGIMTEDRITVIYYYQAKDTSVLVHHYAEGTTNKVSEDVTINGKVDDTYRTIEATDVPVYYELVAEPENKTEIMTEDQIVVIYYYKLKDYPYTVNYLEQGTDKVLSTQKQGDNKEWGTEITAAEEKITIDGYRYVTANVDPLTITEEVEDNVLDLYYVKRNDLSYIVHYKEKGTNRTIKDDKEVPNQTFEDKIQTSTEVIEIAGYNYDSVDKEELTITTGTNEITIWYTKRNDLSYTVNYLEKGTGRVIHDQKQQGDMTFESEVQASDEVIPIYGYNYDSVDKATLVIGANNAENVLNIFYTRRPAKVIVHYYEEGTTNRVSADVEKNGLVNDVYETEEATDVPSKYELVAQPGNKNGVYTEDDIEVIYYYRKKATKVIVHHLEDPTENGGLYVVLAEDEEKTGRVDDPYTTSPSSNVPSKYEVVTSKLPTNAEGTMTEEIIEVTYLYRVKDADLIIKYVDRDTGEEISERGHQEGRVDERYTTDSKPVEGFTLVGDSGNTEGTLTEETITVTYYYAKNTKVTIKYIDEATGEEIRNDDGSDSTEVVNGKVGDEYTSIAKRFYGYVISRVPDDANGTMTREEKTIYYYYNKMESGIIVNYIALVYRDGEQQEEILESYTQNGLVGDEYETTSRTYTNYDLVEERLPANATGRYREEVQEINYYYLQKAEVIVKYVDKYTREEISNPDGTSSREVIPGHEGDRYTTERKVFDNWVLEEVPANADGVMPGGTTEVIYVYKHISGGVVENHINKLTGEQLVEETKHEGYVGEDYETAPKDFANFDLVEEEYPTNATGKFQVEQQRVTYYYRQKASVTVRYIDSETNTDLPNDDGTESKIDMTGHVGDSYTSSAKAFDGYLLERNTDNTSGNMTEDPITVIYYYRKIRFNLKVEKIIKSITVNGIEEEINGDLAKAEVYRKEVKGQTIKVKYIIRVTNDSELEGSAVIRETIPEGMEMKQESNISWRITDNLATLETDTIVPGDTREYNVVLEWNQNGDNIGTKTNNAKIVTTDNKYGYEETDTTDNEDSADLIIAVSTGETNYAIGATMLLIVLCGIAITYKRIDNKRNRVW